MESNLEKELKTFREARESILDWFGLELSTIELWHLRQYSREAVEFQAQNRPEHIQNVYYPGVEAMSRFMSQYYGIRGIYANEENRWLVSIHCMKDEEIEGFKQYMRRLQAERHMP